MEEGLLKIVQLKRYDRPKYPRFGYYTRPPKSVIRIVRDVAPLTAMAVILESCVPPFFMGVPLPPKMVSEMKARELINSTFANEGIPLVPDAKIVVQFAAGDSASLSLDGYNDSLGIGYEYISGEDNSTFPLGVCDRLDDTRYDRKPSILTLQAEYERDAYREHLEHAVKGFLDSLRAHGVI